MNWTFCPHCETQLDEATGICPACRWDPLEEPAPAPVEVQSSITDRYRGTPYDSAAAMAPIVVQRPTALGLSKARTWLLVGVVTLFAIYGALLGWVTYEESLDPPARPAVGATR
jgi:hypothetical protein